MKIVSMHQRIILIVLSIFLLCLQSPAHTEGVENPFFTLQQEKFLSLNVPVYAYFSQMYVEGKTPEQVAKEFGLSDDTNRKYLKALVDIGVIENVKEDQLSSSPRFLVTGVMSYSPYGPLSNTFTELRVKEYHEKVLALAETQNKDFYLSDSGLWMTKKEYEQYKKELKVLEEKYINIAMKNRKSKTKETFRVSSLVCVIPKWETHVFYDVKKDY
jgi:hypothetical protein